MATVTEIEHRQRDDGSLGSRSDAARRILPTILAARSLHEGGIKDSPVLQRALDFLARTAIVDGGGSIYGTRDSVLPCYTGMLAKLFVGTGRQDDARLLLAWIVRYQPVAFGGVVYHQPDGPAWGEYLFHRYGGCMASTTCILGLVPTMSALAAAKRAGIAVDADAHLDAMRTLLVDRRLVFGRSGDVMPLSGRTKRDPAGTSWMLPAFPRSYVIDLIDVVELAVALAVPREAMRDALALLESWRLPDGGWPMLGKRTIDDVYRPEPVNARRSSRIITSRVLALGLF